MVAHALVTGSRGTDHEAEGWAARVRPAARAEDPDAAISACEALDAGFPNADATLASAALISYACTLEETAGRSRQALDVSGLAPGVYVAVLTVRGEGDAAIVSRRFVAAR